MYGSRTLSALATLGAHSPAILLLSALATLGAHSPAIDYYCPHWLHLEPLTHLSVQPKLRHERVAHARDIKGFEVLFEQLKSNHKEQAD